MTALYDALDVLRADPTDAQQREAVLSHVLAVLEQGSDGPDEELQLALGAVSEFALRGEPLVNALGAHLEFPGDRILEVIDCVAGFGTEAASLARLLALNLDGDWGLRGEVVGALATLGERGVEATLSALCTPYDWETVQGTLEALAELDVADERIVARIRGELKGRLTHRVLDVLQALAERAEPLAPDVLAHVAQANVELKVRVLEVLPAMGAVAAALDLARDLAGAEDPKLRAAASRIQGEHGDGAAPLLATLRDADPAVRAAAWQSFPVEAVEEASQALAHLGEGIADDHEPVRKSALLKVLSLHGVHSELVDRSSALLAQIVSRAVEDGASSTGWSRPTAEFVCQELAKAGAPLAEPLLGALQAELDSSTKSALLNALAETGSPAALDLFQGLLLTPLGDLAAKGLGKIGPLARRSLETCFEGLAQRTVSQKTLASVVPQLQPTAEHVDLILPRLEEFQYFNRLLVSMAQEEPALVTRYSRALAASDNQWVKMRIVDALIWLKDEAAPAREALAAALNDSMPGVRMRACDALANLELPPALEDALTRLAQDDENENVRAAACAALTAIDPLPPSARETLAKLAADDESSFVRKQVERSLAALDQR